MSTNASASASPSTSPEQAPGHSWGVLMVLCGAIFLEGIDVAMLNVALPSIRADLGLSTGMLSGVVSAYVLGYGGFMLLGGRAADLLGRRRMFLLWLTVFLVFSGLGGLATEGWTLLIARFVTGVAAAFMTPAGLSIITTGFAEGPARNRALVIYGATGAGGFTLGLVAGGMLTTLGWRWVFFAPVVLSAVILAAAAVLLPKDRPAALGTAPGSLRGSDRASLRGSARGSLRGSLRAFDLGGATTVTGAMLLLVYGVVRLENPAHGPGWTAAALAGGLALLAAFTAIERRSAAPLVRLGILRSGALVRANLGAVLLTGSFFGFQFLVTLYLQELRGWSTMQTGLALLVAGIDVILAPLLTPLLVRRFGNVRVILGGFVVATASYALFLPVGLDWAYTAMLPSLFLLGVAFALTYGPLTIAATDGVAPEEQGLAGGLLNSSFQFGAALGISMVTAVQVAALDGDSPAAQLDAYRAALVVPVAVAVLAIAVTASGLRRRRRGGPGAPAPEGATAAALV